MPPKKSATARDRLIVLRANTAEANRFDEVAEHLGLSVSAAIRFVMKREHEAIKRAKGKR